ncbi:MAG: alpha/beta hydrolase [Betaproteobacteria bacterium]
MKLSVAGSEVYAYTGTRPLDAVLPTIVFVHGAAHDHSVWALQSRYFAYHGRNVLAVDLPAHGRSGGDALATIEAIADWIADLLRAAGVRAATLVGHSMGSLSVLECAARHPECATRIALIGPAAPMAVADALLDAAKRNDHLAYELITGWSYSAGKQLGGNRMPGVWLTGNAMRLMERTKPGVLHADLKACNDYAGGLAAAARVLCPALAIVGARDIMAPPKNAKELIGALPDVRAVDVPDCGHALMAEQPDAVLDALRAFL